MKKIISAALFILIASTAFSAHLIPFEDKSTTLYGFKNAKGLVVVKPQFQVVLPSENRAEMLIAVNKNGHWYRMDSKGNLVFETVFFDNGPDYFEQGLTRFLKDGKVGFHNRSGDVMIEAAYDFATPFKDGHAFVCNGCWGVYESAAKFAPLSSSPTHPSASDNHVSVTGGEWGVINLKGKVVVPLSSSSRELAAELLGTDAQ